MQYAVWLLGISLASIAAERLWPWRRQPVLRRAIASDLAYLVFNSHYLGIFLALAAQQLFRAYDPAGRLSLGLASGLPLWLQFLVVILGFDFLQWCIHNLLHRVGWLWRFHMVHHSIVDMDWIGDWRIHWGEIVVYRVLLYVPTVLMGVDLGVMFWSGIVNTIVGHYAHANVRIDLGPLKYVVNSPQMHIWHHTHPNSGPINRNFGITLSVWDWLFRTAYLPRFAEQPGQLGFEGIETYPASLPGQWLAPFRGHAGIRQ